MEATTWFETEALSSAAGGGERGIQAHSLVPASKECATLEVPASDMTLVGDLVEIR